MHINYKVGDQVIRDYDGYSNTGYIGTVARITEKKNDIVVDYGDFTETYDQNGWQKNTYDDWHRSRIQPLTREVAEQLRRKSLERECRRLLTENEFTTDQLERILEILGEE